MLSLAVGDIVVYGAHGAGTVEARETRSVQGEQQTVVVVALSAGLSVQLPLPVAQEQLRPIVDEAGISTVKDVLRTTRPISSDSWLKRRRDAGAKLRDAIGLAEIIRDGSMRETAPARRSGSQLSPGERDLVRRARELLTKEIALARDVPVGDAEAWIDRQLGVSR
jgi:CarD family transcriptional regulator, regulator of rRNA transcription